MGNCYNKYDKLDEECENEIYKENRQFIIMN